MAGKPGLMFYFEDYASLRASLNAEELVSVLDAMIGYAERSRLPEDHELSPNARICWRFIKPKLDRDAAAYQRKSESRRVAANKRWSEGAPKGAGDANACKCIESMHLQNLQPTTPTTASSATTAAAAERDAPAADDDLSAQVENYHRADDLIRRFALPDGDTTREALLEDAERHGFDALEDALTAASRNNSRQRVSVNFYRRFLNGGASGERGFIAIDN